MDDDEHYCDCDGVPWASGCALVVQVVADVLGFVCDGTYFELVPGEQVVPKGDATAGFETIVHVGWIHLGAGSRGSVVLDDC